MSLASRGGQRSQPEKGIREMETGSDTESERGNQREGIREGDELTESRQRPEM